MRFFYSIVYLALVVSALNVAVTSGHSDLDAGVDSLRVRQPAAPFHASDSSLMGGHRRMRRRASGCNSHAKTSSVAAASKDSQKHSKSSSKDKKKKSSSKKKSKTSDSDGKKEKKKKSSNKSTSQTKPNGKDVVGKAKGLIGMTFDGQCRNPDASSKYPNGNINFLNCGLSKSNPNGKWSPPQVHLSQLRVISSDEAAKSNTFSACAKYKSAFDNAASKTGVPAVLLMSIAMQESTCNPKVKGGNGEIGMMQLTPDKCSSKDCWNPTTNVLTGAQYFKSQLDSFDGNVLQALGMYNGWVKGLTYNRATSKQYGCQAQNNLDYLNQMLNGWMQGKMGYELKVYNNLGSC